MDNAAINAKLYAKMEESFQDFSNWLLKQQPEEILNHAYEYATKADILAVMETTDLDDAQANALLALDDIRMKFMWLKNSYIK